MPKVRVSTERTRRPLAQEGTRYQLRCSKRPRVEERTDKLSPAEPKPGSSPRGESMQNKQLMMMLLCLAVFATVSASASRQSASDERALRSIIPNFESAWTRCDAKGLAGLWTEDDDFQSPYDSLAKGRAEIEAFYGGAFRAGYCGSRGTGTITNIRLVARNVAIVDGTWDIQGAHGRNGEEVPEEKGRFTAVAAKQHGAWLIVAQREMIPARPR